MKKKVMMSWSSGKDSAWALYQLQQDKNIEVVGLFCSINATYQRVAMHGVRVELLKKQAQALALPLDIIELPSPCSNEDYQSIMSEYHKSLEIKGIEAIAFGDLFLADVRKYREDLLANTQLAPLFPLWQIGTTKLAQLLIENKVQTITTCINGKKLDKQFVGQQFTQNFLEHLPKDIDPCGENGEFHTFVFNAPNFNQPIDIKLGEIVEREGFIFIDLLAEHSHS